LLELSEAKKLKKNVISYIQDTVQVLRLGTHVWNESNFFSWFI